jgi:hypothetical protein
MVLAAPGGDADRGVHPDHRGRRQALNPRVRAQDRAAAEKADAGDDLRRDAARIALARGQLD